MADDAPETGTAEVAPNVGTDTPSTATPLVRKSRIALPGKTGTRATDNARPNPVKDVRDGIKSTVKKFGDDVKKTAEGLGAKRATSAGSHTSVPGKSGGPQSDSSD
jgi:hypothetical protein